MVRLSSIIKFLVGILGLFGIGSITYIIWTCMLDGGDDWELPISFNKSGEGKFEITMITLFLVLYIIGMGYILIEGKDVKKKARLKANEVFKKLDYEARLKYKTLLNKLNRER